MSLDTKVKNLIINTNMTKEQYEAIDDKSNQLFFVEDSSVVDVPAPEENQSGYLHTDGTNLTWEEIESGDKLPDQTGNAGAFLQTDGTSAKWAGYCKKNDGDTYGTVVFDPAGKQVSDYKTSGAIVAISPHGDTKTLAVNISGTASGIAAVSIGAASSASMSRTVAIGPAAKATGSYATALGYDAQATTYAAVGVGYRAEATGSYSIQVGLGENPDDNTFKVGNQNGNFEMMSADGTIPAERMIKTVDLVDSSVELAINTIYNAGETASLTITFPTVDLRYTSQLNFTSGTTATAFTAPDNIKWDGDSVVNGAFVPETNKRYVIMFYYDGVNICAIARG